MPRPAESLIKNGLDDLNPDISNITANALSDVIAEEIGVAIDPYILQKLRRAERQSTSYYRAQIRPEAEHALQSSDYVNDKLKALVAINSVGLAVREPIVEHPHLWQSSGFHLQISDPFAAIGGDYLRQIIRGMRLDLILYSDTNDQIIHDATTVFNNFLAANLDSPNSKHAQNISEKWNGSVRSFYQIMYSPNHTVLGSFLPWEIEIFATMYGRHLNSISAMDTIVLGSLIETDNPLKQRNAAVTKLSQESGIIIDYRTVINAWAGLLLS
jgi:hypothetical protein